MIDVKDIRAITEGARNKTLIEKTEEAIKKAAYRGCSHISMQYELPKSSVRTMGDYFRSSGFYFDYQMYGMNNTSGVPIYTITIRW